MDWMWERTGSVPLKTHPLFVCPPSCSATIFPTRSPPPPLSIYPIACQANRRDSLCSECRPENMELNVARSRPHNPDTPLRLSRASLEFRLEGNKNAIRRQTNYNYIVACFPIDRLLLSCPCLSSPPSCAFLQINGDLQPQPWRSIDRCTFYWLGWGGLVVVDCRWSQIDRDVRNIKSHDLFWFPIRWRACRRFSASSLWCGLSGGWS